MKRLDFLSPTFAEDPWPVYERLRHQQPVWWCEEIQMLCVFSHRHVVEALRHKSLTVEFPFRISRQAFGQTLLDIDGPDHRRQRNALLPILQAKHVSELVDEIIIRAVDRALDDVERTSSCDFMTAFAEKVPAAVICEAVGIPPADIPRIFEIVTSLTMHLDGSSADFDQVTRWREQLDAYLEGLPAVGGSPLTRELFAKVAQTVSATELHRIVVLLLAAGMETSVCSLGNILHAVLRHPAVLAAVLADPSLARAVVREGVRWEPAQHDTVRFASEPVTLGGVDLAEGGAAKIVLASANRDETVFDDAGAFDPFRTDRPNCSFSMGPHSCIGKVLAMRQLETAFERLFARFSSIEADSENLPPITGYTFRRPERLPIRVTGR
ncbi:MAG TPA: cytochrome P450 [Kofleriaceae bacterium]|nr:cytochrome P450 [Kofleriaceae bacterium]